MDSNNNNNNNNNTNVARFLLADKKYYIRTVWLEESFDLSLSDGKHVWFGEASKDFVENNLKPKGMSTNEFMKIIQHALTNQDFTKTKYSYTLEQLPHQPQDLLFSWFIKLGSQNGSNNSALNSNANKKALQVKCALPLTKQVNPRPIMLTILDWLIDKSSRLEQSNQELSENNNQLQSQRDQALAQFSTLVADKKSLEMEMYKKFVLVLNEKKKKIRELKEEVKNALNVTQHQEMASSEPESESSHSPARSRSPSPPPIQKSHTTLGSIDKLTPSIDLLEPVAPLVIPIRKRHRLGDSDTPVDNNNNNNTVNGNNNDNNKSKKPNHTMSSNPNKPSNGKPIDKNGTNSNNNSNNNLKTSLKPQPPIISSPKVLQKSPYKSSNISSPSSKAKRQKSIDDDDPDDLLDLI